MFDILPASNARLRVHSRWVSTSVAIHAVAAAVLLTRSALQATRTPVPEEAMQLYLPPPVPALPAPEAEPFAEPPLEGFPTIPPVRDIPPDIPPVDFSRRPFDPRDFTGIGKENGLADAAGSPGVNRGLYKVNSALEEFDPAVLLSQFTPRYPAVLQSAGVAGSVVVEFVIDTTGRVERASVRIIESSHPAFADAARAAVLGARFRPAHLAGSSVRQITRQAVRFVAVD
jgi:TonB family protein